MRRLALSLLLLLVLAAPAPAGLPATRARTLLTLADSPAELRARLLAYADSAASSVPYGAGEALYYAGWSFQRDGAMDSAIVCHRRAVELRGATEEQFALADQLLLRRGPGDAAAAITLLEPMVEAASLDPSGLPHVLGRLAWARFLAGATDSAAALFAPIERELLSQPEWRYRMARVSLARGDHRHTVDLLLPNAVLSRGTDEEVVGLLEKAGTPLGVVPRIKDEVARGVEARDKAELALAKSLGGRLLTLPAEDGFALGALMIPAEARTSSRSRTRLTAVVMMAPGDTLASADSLALALHGHGLTVLLLQPRGSGGSVGANCPMPDAWVDREVAMQSRVARDVRDALRALARVTPVDTTRYVVAGVGPTVSTAVEAATLDRRVGALLLVSPAPAAVDRGTARARLAQLQMPVYFQTAPEDFDATYEITEALYQAGDRAASRVVESNASGRGLALFRADPALARRFLHWLDSALPPARKPPGARPARPATPPTPRH
jgi:predicted alpha/beta hydrolase